MTEEDWRRREKVWADTLSEEILARKASELALTAFLDGKFSLDQKRWMFIEGYMAGARDYCDGQSEIGHVQEQAEMEWQYRQQPKE